MGHDALPCAYGKLLYHCRGQKVKHYFVNLRVFAGAVRLPCVFMPMNWIIVALMTFSTALALLLLCREGLLRTQAAWLLSSLLILLAMGLRLLAFDYETLDYQNFLSRWAAFYRQNGGFAAVKYPVGNYNIPYLYFLALFSYIPAKDLYLIKWLSVSFDVLLAWASTRLTGRFTQSVGRRLACFFAVLFLPTVYFNSAVWSQCDSIYVALLILGIELALSDRPKSSMICAALAFGFKLQAVFVLPVYAVLWFKGKFRWTDFLLFPLSYVLLVLPAVLLGRPFLDTVTLYASQTGSIGAGLNYNSPSVFAIFWNVRDPATASVIAIVAAFVFLFNMLGIAWINRSRLSDQAVLGMALMFAIGIPFLLPHMHERYFYAADILALVLAFSLPGYLLAAPLVQFASLLGYHAYRKMRYLLPMRYGSAALILAFALALICYLSGTHSQKSRKKRT